jgi:hypothetical protein
MLREYTLELRKSILYGDASIRERKIASATFIPIKILRSFMIISPSLTPVWKLLTLRLLL